LTINDIHTSFAELLQPNHVGLQRKRRAAGLTGKKAAWYRHQLKCNKKIALDTKIKWLERAGIDIGKGAMFTDRDMIDFLRFSRRKDSQRSAEMLGDEYLLDKYKMWKQQGRPAVIRVN
jgi:hypothetical protein